MDDPFREGPWWSLLEEDLGGAYLSELLSFVEALGDDTYPPRSDVFRALELTPPHRTKAVIIGQDPYHGPGQAHGLCFSVRPGFKPIPPSLRSILRELDNDGFRSSEDGNLEPWAHQGVLLLNTALTVQRGKPASHSSRWRPFTDAVVRIAARRPDRVFLLWGAHAIKRKPIIKAVSGHGPNILMSSHPAPPACYLPCAHSPAFMKSHPFSKTNDLLASSGLGWIDWNLAPAGVAARRQP
jgi:uracil-DNA glycosylase